MSTVKKILSCMYCTIEFGACEDDLSGSLQTHALDPSLIILQLFQRNLLTSSLLSISYTYFLSFPLIPFSYPQPIPHSHPSSHLLASSERGSRVLHDTFHTYYLPSKVSFTFSIFRKELKQPSCYRFCQEKINCS